MRAHFLFAMRLAIYILSFCLSVLKTFDVHTLKTAMKLDTVIMVINVSVYFVYVLRIAFQSINPYCF